MKTKILLSAAVLTSLCMTTGCATAITSYRISNGEMECPPQVIADTSIGVSVHVNDNSTCEQQSKIEIKEVQQSDQKDRNRRDAHSQLVGMHQYSHVHQN